MNEWSRATLGDVLALEYGKALPERVRDGKGAPVLGSNGVVGYHSAPLVSGPGIVVGRKGTAGSVHRVDSDFFPIDTTYFVRLRDTTAMSMGFAALMLVTADLPRICAQTGVPGLNRDRAYELPVLLPPLPEQRRIADVMSAVDAQLEALEDEAGAAATAREMLRNELSTVAERQPLAELADVNGIQIGPFGSQLHAHEYVDEGTPVVMPKNIIEGRIVSQGVKRIDAATATRLARHRLSAGDIVFPRRGDLSKRAIVSADQDGWVCGTGCLRFRAKPGSTAQTGVSCGS